MFSKFNCDISDNFYVQNIHRYRDIGRKIYEEFQQQSQDCLKEFIFDNGHIDGTALQNHWFEIKHADVFISHSHKDIEKVTAFAGWLKYEFGLISFIDSCTWGYCDDLLKLIDDQFCKYEGGNTYDYQLRNYTTSHVHAMLLSAILEMIDKTECLIFYNTPQSIYLEKEIENISNNKKTLSPWIYNELSATNVIRQRKPSRLIRIHESFKHHALHKYNDRSLPQFEYNVSAFLNNIIKLNDKLLTTWSSRHNDSEHALDTLYKLVSPK